jgi:hypothetical protein
MPLPRTAAPPCLPLDIKDSLKEEMRLLLWAFCFGLFAVGFLLEAFGFWLFDVGSFWKGKGMLKGK